MVLDKMDKSLGVTCYEAAAPYNEHCAKYAVWSMLKSLEYLHDRHIMHRDIKGDNFLMDFWGSIKLADFGQST